MTSHNRRRSDPYLITSFLLDGMSLSARPRFQDEGFWKPGFPSCPTLTRALSTQVRNPDPPNFKVWQGIGHGFWCGVRGGETLRTGRFLGVLVLRFQDLGLSAVFGLKMQKSQSHMLLGAARHEFRRQEGFRSEGTFRSAEGLRKGGLSFIPHISGWFGRRPGPGLLVPDASRPEAEANSEKEVPNFPN